GSTERSSASWASNIAFVRARASAPPLIIPVAVESAMGVSLLVVRGHGLAARGRPGEVRLDARLEVAIEELRRIGRLPAGAPVLDEREGLERHRHVAVVRPEAHRRLVLVVRERRRGALLVLERRELGGEDL